MASAVRRTEMAELSGGSSAVLAGTRMIESAQRSVVQVRSGGRGIGPAWSGTPTLSS